MTEGHGPALRRRFQPSRRRLRAGASRERSSRIRQRGRGHLLQHRPGDRADGSWYSHRRARARDCVRQRGQPGSRPNDGSPARACGPPGPWCDPVAHGRQLVTESVAIAVVGGAVGLLLSVWTLRFLYPVARSLIPSDSGRVVLDLTPDLRVFAYTAGVAVVAASRSALCPRGRRPSLCSRLRCTRTER